MKKPHVLILVALVVSLFVFASAGGAVTPENTTPEQATELSALEQAEADAEASGDTAALAKARADLQAFEERVLRERAGPIVGALSAVHPLAAALSPLALALVPLFGKRGRAMAKKGVSALNPFTPVEDGKVRGIALGEAASAAWAYLGGGHSTPEGAAALKKSTAASVAGGAGT
jgi:hypothetical protein